jgi:CheY-like chemotaxis protein
VLPNGQFLPGSRVLLVDDVDLVRDTIARMLRALGLDVVAASHPTAALRIACDPAERIDLVISDFMMPDIDGQSLLSAIFAVRPNIKAVLISGSLDSNPFKALGRQSDGTHCVEFLAKPFGLSHLRDTIAKLIGVKDDRHGRVGVRTAA